MPDSEPPLPGMTPLNGLPVRRADSPAWSAAAITGFVCSLLGCLAIPAIAGLVLGIVGVVKTSGGKRRGFGLAVAAIPLSIMSGLASVFLVLGYVVARQLHEMPDRIEAVFAIVSSQPAEAVDMFRELASPDFNLAVRDEALAQWFQHITAEHGTLTKVLVDPSRPALGVGPSNEVTQSFQGRFVNDTATIHIAFAASGGFGQIKIDDILIGGSSPRDGGE